MSEFSLIFSWFLFLEPHTNKEVHVLKEQISLYIVVTKQHQLNFEFNEEVGLLIYRVQEKYCPPKKVGETKQDLIRFLKETLSNVFFFFRGAGDRTEQREVLCTDVL